MARILIVDDEAPVLEALTGLLESQGHHVTQARDGCQALDRFEQDRFDLILTDVVMPNMNGFDLIREIQLRINHRIPLVVLSSHGDPAGIQGAIYAGAFDYILKPAEPAQVLEKVELALAQGRAWAAQGAPPPEPPPSLPTHDEDPAPRGAPPAVFASPRQHVTVPLPPTDALDEGPPDPNGDTGTFGRLLRVLHLR